MCARIFLSVSDEELADFLETDGLPAFAPRYNIAPGQDVLVLRATPVARRAPALLRWGLVPYWSKDASGGTRLINARSETAARRAAFKDSLRERRCLIPAAGFYEWKKEGTRRQPYAIRSRMGLVALAGLWDAWEGQGRRLETFTVLTTEASPVVAQIHDRMPVILERDQFSAWLDPDRREPEDLAEWLRPYPADRVTVQAVSTRVNKVDCDDPACLQLETAPPPLQRTLF
jgi:putative SOS response-associated peptidase YedK